ncbi:hypothetical protein [Vibrio aestuarianus]|uniref:Uncharacterized protein n=1 Tax=Vibrio aestuarianus TaxID=28171 RepID=A0ABN8TP98_9VIBR|nr:hypothetical protein [Vibrio aestuarianus]MDE1229086.1 hypothetical protein [Vibrio aestuarianus]MDE1255182.1 hypothetical protein [Vibrio aestuarianus]MDE1272456.1 hypothetical protein [Vibrio aestuarianus]MDH5892880.1 hypothetical protein [Vibrio aestuarianus]MDH5901641.1 hypothetical protein [Vibrio aestuarianus]
MNNKQSSEQEKIDYIRQCIKDGEIDYANGACVDGKEFLALLDAEIERLEDEEDRKLILERWNDPTIEVNLDDL